MKPIAIVSLLAAVLFQLGTAPLAAAAIQEQGQEPETPVAPLEIRFDDETLIERVGVLRALLAKKPLDRDAIRDVTLALRSLRAAGDAQPANDEAKDALGTVALVPIPGRPELSISPREYALRLALSLSDEALSVHVALEAKAAEARQGTGSSSSSLGRLFPLSPLGQESLWRAALTALEAGDARNALAQLEEVELAAARGLAPTAATATARRSLQLLAIAQLDDRAWLQQVTSRAQAEALSPLAIAGAKQSLSAFTAALDLELEKPAEGPTELAAKASWTEPWASPAEGRARLRPQLGASSIHLHNHERAAALDLETGRVLWTRSFLDAADFPAPSGDSEVGAFQGALGAGAYVFASRDSDDDENCDSALVALDAASGATRWVLRHPFADTNLIWDPAPLFVADLVLATARDREPIPATWIVGIEAKTGNIRWSRRLRSKLPFAWNSGPDPRARLPRALGCSPLVAVGRLVALTDHRGQILLLDPRDGMPRLRWDYPRRRAEGGLGQGGALAPGWSQSPAVAEGEFLAIAPNDSDHAICLAARPSDDPRALRDGEILVRYETIPRRGGYRLETLRAGRLLLAARDRDLAMNVLRGLQPFPSTDEGETSGPRPWTAPYPLDGPIWAFGDSGGKNVYVGTEGYVYRVNCATGRSGDPLLTLGPQTRGPGALLVHPAGLVVVGPTDLAFIPASAAR